MSEGGSFHGSPRTAGAWDRRLAAIVTVLVVAFIGVAVAKPWGSPAEPTTSRGPSPAPTASPPPASLPPTAPELASAALAARVGPLPVAFTTPVPPAAPWTALRWRRLAPDDPLSLVTSVLRWSRGFVAVGWEPRLPATPVWTSADGMRWEPLIAGTSATFWRGLAVLAMAELRTGLVALTEAMAYCGEPCRPTYVVPVISWTSPDGRRWTPHLVLPPDWLASPPGRPPLVAVGPAGLVVASGGSAAHLATSTDGSHWHLSPTGAFPPRFALDDLRGTATGYVAVGRWTTAENPDEAASLWSGDGRRWSALPTLLPTPPGAAAEDGAAVVSLAVGRDGLIAVGAATTRGVTGRWQSADGRRWTALPELPPGPPTCAGEGCASQPDGALGGDGDRLVVVRGGPDARAWVSTDGRSWRGLTMTGDIPPVGATRATLLPSGILVTDGSATWFGEAVGG